MIKYEPDEKGLALCGELRKKFVNTTLSNHKFLQFRSSFLSLPKQNRCLRRMKYGFQETVRPTE
jgi:hypothetical protein